MPLELIAGPMFSGKTLELILRLRAARERGEDVYAGKPVLDGDRRWLVSAAGPRWPADLVQGVSALRRLGAGATVVGVDEVQFFGAEETAGLVELGGDSLHVIAAGLDLDFRGEPFPSVELLASVATTVTRLTAVCARCGAAATHSQRLLDGRPAPATTPTIMLGGHGLYESRCAACHEVS